jgi:hypothetical protein
VAEKCLERKLLLSQWTDSSSRVKKLLDEQRATTKISEQSFASFEEEIRLARAAEIEARRTYFDHVNTHGCP